MSDRDRTWSALQTLKQGREVRVGAQLARAQAEVDARRAQYDEACRQRASHQRATQRALGQVRQEDAAALQQAEEYARGRALQQAELRIRVERCRAALERAEHALTGARAEGRRAQAERVLVDRHRARHARERDHRETTD